MTDALTSTISTPIGPFTVVTTDDDHRTVLASGWTDDLHQLLPVIAPALRPDSIRTVTRIDGVTDVATAYHEGEFDAVETVDVRQASGPFLTHAWDILRTVKPGSPISYTEFAVLAGRPAAVRGAAPACARNAAALFVPCHRVFRSDGSLGGFRWGLPAKRWLLDHEQLADHLGDPPRAQTASAAS